MDGAPGAAGTAGADGARFEWLDDGGTVIAGLEAIGTDAFYWDGSGFWAVDPLHGVLVDDDHGVVACLSPVQVHYHDSACAGDPFMAGLTTSRVRCDASGTYWRGLGSIPHTPLCYTLVGAVCQSTGCPGHHAQLVEPVPVGEIPDLSAYGAPFTLAIAD